jgi:hypothetical protein
MVERMVSVRPYAPSDAAAWDGLIERSRNGNFLHRRDYMDYHADRFVDHSLMVERGGDIVAVFPANIQGNVVASHSGLTYAGLITSHGLRAESAIAVFEQMGRHYRALGVERVIYKAVPHVFHGYPAEEDLYALHRQGARLKRRDISSVISLRERLPFTQGRKHSVDKARRSGICLQTAIELKDFHALLSNVLQKHGVCPTHSLDELSLLRQRFSQQIVLYEARLDDELLAGVLVYDFGRVVHTQYMAVSERGRRLDALSLLMAELIETIYADRLYFTFGISSEQEGRELNAGLIAQKEYFGARAVVHDTYEWAL